MLQIEKSGWLRQEKNLRGQHGVIVATIGSDTRLLLFLKLTHDRKKGIGS